MDWSYQGTQQNNWAYRGEAQVTPQDISSAQQNLGSTVDSGECQRFVEKMVYGKTGLFPSAIAAADYYSKNGQMSTDPSLLKPGSLIYFHDPNQPDGHVGIFEGDGRMISATNQGVREDNLNDWVHQTGQQIMGFVPLGGNNEQ